MIVSVINRRNGRNSDRVKEGEGEREKDINVRERLRERKRY